MATGAASQAVLVEEAAVTLTFLENTVAIEQGFAVRVAHLAGEQQARLADAFGALEQYSTLAQRAACRVELGIDAREIDRDRFREHLAKAIHSMSMIVH